ncbi:hypothetical protein HN51_019272 [Arachis hypogaea]
MAAQRQIVFSGVISAQGSDHRTELLRRGSCNIAWNATSLSHTHKGWGAWIGSGSVRGMGPLFWTWAELLVQVFVSLKDLGSLDKQTNVEVVRVKY